MPQRSKGRKAEALRRNSSLNPHPERVQDPLFLKHAFLDPRDIVQVRYEMLRRVRLEGMSVSRTAQLFGLTRPTWYAARRAYEAGGLPGLVPDRPGPRGPRKLNQEAVAFLRAARAKQPQLRTAELVELVRAQFGIGVHRRTVERALAGEKK
ncbi:MAG: helix-turn-helix domain-containing protein [Bryobacterales bacterium]|nr:helix-turn-helix domain-containing protein [Bryobacterales bacterium]